MLRIRKSFDGTFWIPRSDKETEDYLDSQYVRMPNQLKWRNSIPNMLGAFKNIYKDRCAYIVGKGLSLDNISKGCFQDSYCPIFCINDSIHAIEKLNNITNDLYITQLDSNLNEKCRPKRAKMFHGPLCSHLYQEGVYKYEVDPFSFGLDERHISAQYAIMIARYMGCTQLELFCFDSCVNKNTQYAKCIGYPSDNEQGSSIRFLSHKAMILSVVKEMPLTWVTPRADGTVLRTEAAI